MVSHTSPSSRSALPHPKPANFIGRNQQLLPQHKAAASHSQCATFISVVSTFERNPDNLVAISPI
jgi:hypothetical protein